MKANYNSQDRGDSQNYRHYLEAMDAIAIEKVASASSFFEPRRGNTIVDVGMASGTSSAILAGLFPELHIVGVDINPRMVDIARSNYRLPNLSFRVEDGEKLSGFEPGSIQGFFNCSSIHHITSFNGYDTNHALRTLQRQAELLSERGVIVVRDFVKPEEKEILLELPVEERTDRPNDPELLLEFSRSARSLAAQDKRGFPIEELESLAPDTRRFRLYYTDAVEFIRRKDYYANWDIELQEEYGYLTQREFEEIFQNLGLRIILSAPIYNQWIINNRYRDKFLLSDTDGKEIGFPPTNYLIAGEKTSRGKYISPVRRLPLQGTPFLLYQSYVNQENNRVYDVVGRPNEVIDILPYFHENDRLMVMAKHGYPRPVIGVNTDSPVPDDKHYSGYVTEMLTMEKTEDIKLSLNERFNISPQSYLSGSNALTYYTSPGGIDERVSSVHIELSGMSEYSTMLQCGYSGFSESGYLHVYDAVQLLNTAQTGALVEARLELNIYHLFERLRLDLPHWLGENIHIEEGPVPSPSDISQLLSNKKRIFLPTDRNADFLRTERVDFYETGVTGSHSVREFVYPSGYSTNTLITLPVTKVGGEIFVGLELRDLPVPQLHSGSSSLLTVPAKRLSKTIKNMYDLNCYKTGMRIGKSTITKAFKLGEKYYPSIGITPEQVYPYVVCLDHPAEILHWLRMDDLMAVYDRLEDGHLLICLARLRHALK